MFINHDMKLLAIVVIDGAADVDIPIGIVDIRGLEDYIGY